MNAKTYPNPTPKQQEKTMTTIPMTPTEQLKEDIKLIIQSAKELSAKHNNEKSIREGILNKMNVLKNEINVLTKNAKLDMENAILDGREYSPPPEIKKLENELNKLSLPTEDLVLSRYRLELNKLLNMIRTKEISIRLRQELFKNEARITQQITKLIKELSIYYSPNKMEDIQQKIVNQFRITLDNRRGPNMHDMIESFGNFDNNAKPGIIINNMERIISLFEIQNQITTEEGDDNE